MGDGRAHNRAARDRIPSCVSPFDLRLSHTAPLATSLYDWNSIIAEGESRRNIFLASCVYCCWPNAPSGTPDSLPSSPLCTYVAASLVFENGEVVTPWCSGRKRRKTAGHQQEAASTGAQRMSASMKIGKASCRERGCQYV